MNYVNYNRVKIKSDIFKSSSEIFQFKSSIFYKFLNTFLLYFLKYYQETKERLQNKKINRIKRNGESNQILYNDDQRRKSNNIVENVAKFSQTMKKIN